MEIIFAVIGILFIVGGLLFFGLAKLLGPCGKSD